MNHYPHHIGDFNNATRHLTRVERSLYRDILELYYDTETPLNSDPVKIGRRVLAVSEEEKCALNLVLEEFFVLQDDGWHNTRCDAEIAKYQGQIEKASRAGKASAAKRYGKNLTPVERTFNQPEPEPEPEPIEIHSLSPLATACPHDKLIDLYAQHLPNLPQPRKSLWLKSKNAPALRSRWKWVMTECHESGARKGIRLATTEEEGLEWFSKFFGYVNDSDFLTGRNGKFTGCDLGWLMTLDNFSKTLQGNYHPVKAAA